MANDELAGFSARLNISKLESARWDEAQPVYRNFTELEVLSLPFWESARRWPIDSRIAGAGKTFRLLSPMDPHTLRTVADLARKRAAHGASGTTSDGLMRLGAHRALEQLAADLEASADAFTPRRSRHRPRS